MPRTSIGSWQEVVPLYYGRDETTRRPAGPPRCAVSIASTIWRFSTMRMLHEYTERMLRSRLRCRGQATGQPPDPRRAQLSPGVAAAFLSRLVSTTISRSALRLG